MKARIKSVSVRSSIAVANFQHVHIEASSDVPVSMTAEQVVADLKKFVAEQLVIAKEGRNVRPVVKSKPSGRFLDEFNESTRRLFR